MAVQLDPSTGPAAILAEAVALDQRLHLPGVRDRYRGLLDQAIRDADLTLPTAVEAGRRESVQWIRLKAHVARAEDARYGAGQLSRGAQRAPTEQDCHDGWRRVEEIVANASQSASEARAIASELSCTRSQRLAVAAEVSAAAARELIDQRNHAYTFHTDPGFSFGEGWYAAAAALLAGSLIQIEPDRPQTSQAESFLRSAGLGPKIVPYRPRPRANKQLTAIIANAFRREPLSVQLTVRAAFLGDTADERVRTWCENRLASARGKKLLLWVRSTRHDSHRNTDFVELSAIAEYAKALGLIPVLFGDNIADKHTLPPECIDLTLAWKQSLFQGPDMRRAQLWLFEIMRSEHDLVGQIGVTTAGMDGPALIGVPTIYLSAQPNVRMRRWVGAVPGYCEVIRTEGYLDSIKQALRIWHSGRPVGASHTPGRSNDVPADEP